MNVALWILQAVLALHTLMGAAWKLSNTEAAVPSLRAIPHALWLSLSAVEVLCAVGLLLPAISRRFGVAAPVAAVVIAAEMVLFAVVHFGSGDSSLGHPAYWLVVAVVCAVVAWGRFAVAPL